MVSAWKIIGFAFVLRLLFIIGMPLEESSEPRVLSAFNDEKAHFKYVLKMSQEGFRPRQSQYYPEDFHKGEFEYYQPPLWYQIAGGYLSLLPSDWRTVRAVRLINALIGILTILTIGRVMLFFSPQLCLSSMLFTAQLGCKVYFDAVVINDVLLWLFCSLLVFFGTSSLKNKDTSSRWGMILSFSAGVWSKQSALILAPAIFYVIFTGLERESLVIRCFKTIIYIVIGLMLCLPLFWENYLYYGMFVPLSIGSGEPFGIGEGLNLQFLVKSAAYALRSFYFPFTNYWGGASAIIIFLILGSISLIIIYRGIKHGIDIYRNGLLWHRRAVIFMGMILVLAIAGYLMMVFRYHQTEARHTFVALPAITYLFLSGSYALLGKRNYRLAQFIAGMTALPYLLFLL
jgi:hypothetical protein